jgi:predicted hydrocarbon binding protein
MKMSGNSILQEMVYDPAQGALNYKGVRYLLIRPETLAGIQKGILETCGKDGDEKLFGGGFEGGYLSAKKYKEIHQFSDREILEFMIAMGSEIGWGSFRLVLFDPSAKRIHIAVEHSPFAEAYGRSSGGVCHLIRGVVSGMASVVFGRKCIASETRCHSKGDDRCLFVVEAETTT